MPSNCIQHILPSGVPCIRPPMPVGPETPRLPVMTVNGVGPDAKGNVVVNPTDLTELEVRVDGLDVAVREESRRAVGAEKELGDRIASEVSRAQSAIADRYTKRETDEKIAAATPSDYDVVKGRVSAIEAKVPAQASDLNQLADKDFVNSTVATNTAFYISDGGSPFQSLSDLENYEGDLTNNDYAFVVGMDAAGNTTYTRYKWNEDTETWAEEYVLNNSSFTAAQWAAISSGITSGLVAKIVGLPTAEALATELSGKVGKADLATHTENKNNPHSVTAEQAGAVPLVVDINGEKTAVTIGSRNPESPVGANSLANGSGVASIGTSSHAEGLNASAAGSYSHAEGAGTDAPGTASHSEGADTEASGIASHAEGNFTTASGNYSHSEGDHTDASGVAAHAEGLNSRAFKNYSHAEGDHTNAAGIGSHAEGGSTTATGDYSHTEGQHTTAAGSYSHAEGADTNASGNCSHAEGDHTTASGSYSHAEGNTSSSSGKFSHAEGSFTDAVGNCSHAAGFNAIASGDFTYTWNGDGSISTPYSSHGQGTFNINPVGGISGLYIGDKTLTQIINEVIAARLSAIDPDEASVYDLIKALKGE